MPKVKFDKVLTFSSEDPHYPAINLLNPDPTKKWKCANNGEKKISIVLKLEKAVQITGIDLGNEHSAFVEVLVTREDNDDYKTLLSTAAFMSPLESRNSENVNKVRMYTAKDLSQPECNEKWDRIKLVCAQPYNSHVQFGLSFVCLHTNEGALLENKKKNVSKFTLRPDSPSEYSVGLLFSREANASSPKLSGAAAIREAFSRTPTPKSPILRLGMGRPSTSRDSNDTEASTSDNSTQRNRNSLLYNNDDETPNAKIDRIIDAKKREKAEQRSSDTSSKKRKSDDLPENESPKKKQLTDRTATDTSAGRRVLRDVNPDMSRPGTSRLKRRSTDEDTMASPKKKKKTCLVAANCMKPYNRLLEGVVIVISGIQNPERADLRTNALAMGASYKPDWDPSCTHLICAFASTPKFNQVKGRGKIVRKQWIQECAKQRKRLPWRRFALDRADQTGEESEEEIVEEVSGASNEENDHHRDCDTDEEIERIQRNQHPIGDKKTNNTKKIEEETVRDNRNKPEEQKKEQMGQSNGHHKLPNLPNYFSGLKFYLSPGLGSQMMKDFIKYIVAYDGEIIDNITDIDNSVVAIAYRDDLEEVKSLREHTTELITPVWLLECHNKKRLLPFDDFYLN